VFYTALQTTQSFSSIVETSTHFEVQLWRPITQRWTALQCYDKYLRESLKKAAEERGHPEWATGPSNAGEYNSKPQDTGFFRDGGDYDSYYGRFFLNWYSKVLIEHGDQVLRLANLAFEGVKIAAKVSTVALENTHLVVDICIPYDLLKLRCETILAHH
jgi:hypothetical protein